MSRCCGSLIARLAALIPPPKFHMIRYHGVLAAHANARSENGGSCLQLWLDLAA